jgi:hypothetical protein
VQEEETGGRKGMTRGPGRSVEDGDLTGGAQVSAGKRRGRRTSSARGRTGPWAASLAGPVRSPRPVFLFFLFFHFSFLFFLFPSYNLQKCFKTIQTTFKIF